MDKYKAPKLKIKTSKAEYGESAEDKQDMQLQNPGSKTKIVPMSQSLKLIPNRGKTTRMTTEDEVDPNIMDARAGTKEVMDRGMEMMKIKNELKLRKKLQGM